MKIKVETREDAPSPKTRIAEIPELTAALLGLKKGQSFLMAYSDVEKRVAAVHVQRAQKKLDEKEGNKLKLVTKDMKDEKGLRVWAV